MVRARRWFERTVVKWRGAERILGRFSESDARLRCHHRISFYDDEAPTWRPYPWRLALAQQHPEIVRDVYLAVARLRLSKREEIVHGLYELLNEVELEPFRGNIVIELLGNFPNANSSTLAELFKALSKLPSAHAAFLELAARVLTDGLGVDERHRDLWLTAAYILAPDRYESAVEARAAQNPSLVFDLRDRSGFAQHGQPSVVLPLQVMEFLARLTGALFSETPPPGRWGGDRNRWDATDYFHTLTNTMSTLPSEAATNALVRLEANPATRLLPPTNALCPCKPEAATTRRRV